MTPPQHDELPSWMHHDSNIVSKPCKKRRISRHGCCASDSNHADECTSSQAFWALDALQKCVQELGRAVGCHSGEQRITVLKDLLSQLQEGLDDSSAHQQPDDTDIAKYARRIQNVLILQLGYTLSIGSTQQIPGGTLDVEDNEDQQIDMCLSLLCQCLCKLYKYLNQNALMDTILNATEYKELLMLLSQILDRQVSHFCKDETMVEACLQVSWFMQMSRHSHQFCEMESILTSLLRLVSGTAHCMESAVVHKKALRMLEELSQQEPKTRAKTVCTAAHVITGIQQCNHCLDTTTRGGSPPSLCLNSFINQELYEVGSTIYRGRDGSISWVELIKSLAVAEKHDALLFIRCLSFSSQMAKRLAGCHELLDVLHLYVLNTDKEDDKLPVDAAECLSSIANYCGVCYSMELVVVLMSIVCRAPRLAVKRKAVCGLSRLVLHGNTVAVLMEHLRCDSDKVTFEQLVQSLKECMVDNSESDFEMMQLNEKAVHLIEGLVIYTAHKEEHNIEYEKGLAALALLLYKHDHNVVHVAVCTICKLAKDKQLRRHLGQQEIILMSLSHVLSSEFLAADIKLPAVEAMWNLTLESENVLVLVRKPTVLEALVKVVSTGSDHNTRDPIRRYAVQTLIKLSNLVCNQRVLARQTGLMACLIRFVRALPLEDDDFDKDKLKDRILKLAVLL